MSGNELKTLGCSVLLLRPPWARVCASRLLRNRCSRRLGRTGNGTLAHDRASCGTVGHGGLGAKTLVVVRDENPRVL